MTLELNELLQGICSWKNLLNQKDEQNENLRKQLSQALKRNEILESTCSNLLSEVSQLNSAVSSLRNSLMKIENLEVDRKLLLEEKQGLKYSLDSLEKLCHDQKEAAKQEFEKTKLVNKEETAKLIVQVNDEANRKIQTLKSVLEEKENHIEELKDIIKKQNDEKDQDLLKIKIQYEEKIMKLKQQLPKMKPQAIHVGQEHNIFRQKYITLKKESEEKITKLNEQVKALEMLLESLKTRSESSSLSSAIMSSNKQNFNTPLTITKSVKGSLSKYLEGEISAQDYDDFSIPKKNISKTESLQLQKRRLFNLNQNYFVK